MNKRILVISWFYPPVNSSEGLVTYKLLKYSKYEYDVFTQKNNAMWSYGNKEELPECKNVNVIFAKADNLHEWVKEAIAYYKANKDKYDIVMTRSMPPESHEIGLKIKKNNSNIVWLAAFGDPIANNPYTKIVNSSISPYRRANCRNIMGVMSPKRIIRNTIFNIKNKIRLAAFNRKNLEFQESILKKADYLILNSIYQRDYMLSNHTDSMKSKAIILNHGFDKQLYPNNAKENDRIKMVYVGHLDRVRTPEILLDAIKDLYDEDDELYRKIEFDFYGNMSDKDKLFIINNELTDIIKVKKPVSYIESLDIMKNADWLLQIDGNISAVNDKNIFFAAKLADYIGTGNKIFGITMVEGISADVLRQLNAIITSYSKEEIKNYLWLILYDNYNVQINKSFCENFSSDIVAKEFDDIILSI